MVHRNIHDETVDEALEHENGLTVLAFKFQVGVYLSEEVIQDQSQVIQDNYPQPHSSMDTLAKIVENFLTEPGSKFANEEFHRQVKTYLKQNLFL